MKQFFETVETVLKQFLKQFFTGRFETGFTGRFETGFTGRFETVLLFTLLSLEGLHSQEMIG